MEMEPKRIYSSAKEVNLPGSVCTSNNGFTKGPDRDVDTLGIIPDKKTLIFLV